MKYDNMNHKRNQHYTAKIFFKLIYLTDGMIGKIKKDSNNISWITLFTKGLAGATKHFFFLLNRNEDENCDNDNNLDNK